MSQISREQAEAHVKEHFAFLSSTPVYKQRCYNEWYEFWVKKTDQPVDDDDLRALSALGRGQRAIATKNPRNKHIASVLHQLDSGD